MFDYNFFLLEILFVVCFFRKLMNELYFDVIYLEIGIVYGIFMKRRCKDFFCVYVISRGKGVLKGIL